LRLLAYTERRSENLTLNHDEWLSEQLKKAAKWDAAVAGMKILDSFSDLEAMTRFLISIVEDFNSYGEKLEQIKLIVDGFLNGESTPDNLVREVNEACDALNDIRDILEES